MLAAALVIGVIVFVEKGGDSRARIMRGFAIVHDPPRLVRGVIFPQALSWVLRVASLYYFLEAFRVHASIHNALLALVVDSLATLFPATPGGAGTKQGLIVLLFRGEAISKSLLLAFSVGVNIALVVFNLIGRADRAVHDGADDLVAAAAAGAGEEQQVAAARRVVTGAVTTLAGCRMPRSTRS